MSLQRKRVMGFEVRFKFKEELICVAGPLQHFFFVHRIVEQVVGTMGSYPTLTM